MTSVATPGRRVLALLLCGLAFAAAIISIDFLLGVTFGTTLSGWMVMIASFAFALYLSRKKWLPPNREESTRRRTEFLIRSNDDRTVAETRSHRRN